MEADEQVPCDSVAEMEPRVEAPDDAITRVQLMNAFEAAWLHRQAVAVSFEAAVQAGPVEIGTKVVLTGLIRTPELNGASGVAQEWNRDKQRLAVTLEDGKVVLVRLTCIEGHQVPEDFFAAGMRFTGDIGIPGITESGRSRAPYMFDVIPSSLCDHETGLPLPLCWHTVQPPSQPPSLPPACLALSWPPPHLVCQPARKRVLLTTLAGSTGRHMRTHKPARW